MTDRSPDAQSLAANRIRRALNELLTKHGVFTPETYSQIMLALYNRLREVQTINPHERDGQKVWRPQEDEIRLVTVMFVDVVGSTEMAAQIGDENWRKLIGETHARLANQIKRWDGEVGQYLGDGLLCFFGARRSHGNDAARALSCALAVQASMDEYARQVLKEHLEVTRFELRIGISTGRVIVGMIGTADKSETLAVGTTTNLAARLQQLCPPGRVVVDAETYYHTRQDFRFSLQEAVMVKGFANPLSFYLVEGSQQQTLTHLAADNIAEIPLPFVGREAVMESILDLLHQVERDRSIQVMTITSEIGLGKSRLLQETARLPLANHFLTVLTSGHYERQNTSYSLIREMLATLCDLSDSTPRNTAEQRILDYTRARWQDTPTHAMATAAVIGYLAGYGFTDSPYAKMLQHSEIGKDREQATEWLERWLTGISGDRPTLLLVDNLQWADSESLILLDQLAAGKLPLMLLAVTRPEFTQNRPPYMTNGQSHSTASLHPLNPPETQALIQSILQYVENVPPDLPAQIIQRAEGNPLYIEEFLRMLFDNGVFQRDPNKDGWRVNIFQYRMMEGELPSGLLDVFQARLDDLLGTARRVVQVASVIGQTFWETSVNSIVNIDAKALLDNLIARGIITAKPESRFGADREYQFRNALYHEVAYTMLPRANRMSYHQQAAEWLSARVSAHPEMLGTLAAHYAAADRQIEALKTYLEAAKYHLDVALFAETLKLVAAGLGTAREVPRENALPIVSHLWLIQSRALYATRRYSEATAASSTALMLMEELSTEVLVNERIQAAITLGKAYTSMGNYQQALEVLTQGHQIVSRLTNPTVTAALLRAFGLLFWSMGNLDKAQVYEQQALIAAEDSNDERELASVCSMLARIALDKGRLASALDYLEHVLYINMQQEHILYQIMDLRLIAMVYRNLFAYAESIQTIETAKDLACQINFEDLMLEGSLAISLVGMGQVDVGLARIRAVTANDFLNTYDNLAVQLGLVRALALAGHDDECLRYAPTFFEYARPHNPILYGRGLLWFGLVKWRQKQPDALETLRQALASETMYGGRDLWLCHYALYLADPDATVATQHRQAAEALIQALADSLTSHPSLAAQVTLTNAQRLLAMWWQLPPQHTQP